PARAAVQPGVEQARRVRQGRAPGEGQLDLVPVGFAGADDPTLIPGGDASGFETFRHFTDSTTSGSASKMSWRTRARASPRQPSTEAIFASTDREPDSSSAAWAALMFRSLLRAAVPGTAGRTCTGR